MTFTNFNIYNLTLTNANTEYSQALTFSASYFEVKCRTLSDMKLSLVSGQSGTTYITIPAGASFSSNGQMFGTKTLYLQSGSAGVVAEIIEWA